ncbi:MAG: PEP-CTERM sorting domain-containing protein [Phycisphaerales bacterium]
MKMWNAKVAMCGAVLMLAGAGVSNAATITWQTPTTIAGDTDVDTTGTLVRALNFNLAPQENPTVNGVTFTGVSPTATASWSSGAGAGDITLAVTSGGTWGGDYDGFGGPGTVNPYFSLSADYKTLLTSAVFKHVAGLTANYTLNGLTPGTPYLVQFWMNDSRANFGNPPVNPWTLTSTFTAGNTSGAVDVNATDVGGGVGQYLIGTFTADAATQVISVTGSNDTRGTLLNGYQLREVPEPATLGLLAVGSMLIAVRGRRQQA